MQNALGTANAAAVLGRAEQVDLIDLIDGVTDFVQSVRPDGGIRFVNAVWLRRLGYTLDEALSMNIFQVIHPDHQEHCMHYMQRLMMGENVGEMEVVFVGRDGEPIHLEGRVTVQFDAGMPVATRGIFREVSSARKRDASIVRLREQRKLFQSVLSILRANGSKCRADFLGLVTRKVSEALDVNRVSVWLFDDHRQAICCEYLYADGKSAPSGGLCLTRSAHPEYFAAVESKVPVRADDAHTHLATRSFSEGYLTPLGINSMLDAPIRLGEEIAGVICCEHTGPARHWTNDEEEFALAVAAIVLIFLENERRIAAESKLHQANLKLERLVEERTARLIQSEERLRYVLTSGPSVIYTCEASGNLRATYVSPNIESRLGYPASSFLTVPNFWVDRIHPDDAASARRNLLRAIETGGASYEYRFRFPDGNYRWLRDEFVVIRDGSGTPLEVVGSCVDIHDRRIAENAAQAAANDLRRLIDTANAPIFGKDIHNRVNEWNRCAESITGYTREEVIGKRLTDFVDPDYRAAVIEVLQNALQGVETANFEFPIITKDGRHLLLLLNASTRRDADGAITGMVGVGQDITEHRATELRSLRAQRLESIGTLAGGVAHDVNNALAPILLATGLFRRRHPESRDLIDVMESSARRGAGMVQQLLTFAKGVDGKRVRIRPEALVGEIRQIVTSTFPKNITIDFQSLDPLPTVVGDSTQLHQVLLNLCVNARDAMPGGGRLRVEALSTRIEQDEARLRGDCSPGEYLLVRVSDSGSGIRRELLERIFEPFFSTKSPEQGTGLGLSTAMGIVRSHGGFMRVQSHPGEGSVFSVYLPARSGVEADVEDAPPPSNFRGQGETILVVDDEPAVRDVYRQSLLALGLRVRTATDGKAALEVLREHGPSIAGVITDLHMPFMDGYELTREIRRLYPRLGVVLSSGRVDRSDSAAFARLGFRGRVDKPFTMSELGYAMQQLLPPA